METKETEPKAARTYLPLVSETRSVVDTETAAYHLSRKPQTLRAWASACSYPDGLRPRSVNGRLLWPVDGLRKLVGVDA